jgi:ADP-ribose pyrophosphatase
LSRKPEPKIIGQQIVYRGHNTIRVDRVVEPAGKEVNREIVMHPGSVCIVARPTPEQVIIIRQYRHAAGGELLELPAGTLHPGEDPLECAIRELEEETGYQAARMVERCRFWTTPGFTSEFMYLYEASGLTKTQPNPDDDEAIEVEIVSRDQALRMIDSGEIHDAKTILGLLRVIK